MSFSSKFIEDTVNLEFHKKWASNHPEIIDYPHGFLSSFPRSGNGWLRLVLTTTLLKYSGVDVQKLKIAHKKTDKGFKYSCLNSDSYNYNVEEIFPDIYHFGLENYDILSDQSKSLNIPVKLLKTHHIVNCQDSKTIFLFRDPLPCLVSTALLFNENNLKSNPQEINNNIIYLASFYAKMLSHYLEQYKKNTQNCIFISHKKISDNSEHMEQQKIQQISRIMNFLTIKIEPNLIGIILRQFPFKTTYDKGFQVYIDKSTKTRIKDIIQDKYDKVMEISSLNKTNQII